VDASDEELESENRKIAAHNGYAPALYHVVKNSLPRGAFRSLIESHAAVRLGSEIGAQQDAVDKRQKADQRLRADIARRSKRAGISPILVPVSPDSLESLDDLAKAQAALEQKAEEEE
jgi:predicted metal-dependent hydrolase